MATEPERPIEKLLRAAATKRRDEAGAPLELHPANRRILQGEVARTFAKPGREPRPFSKVLGQLWPRLAWSVAICAVLVVAGYMLLPLPGKGKSGALLAKNEPMPAPAPAKQPLPPPPASAPKMAPPLEPAVKTESAVVAYADAEQPARAAVPRRLKAEPQPLAKDSSAAQSKRAVRTTLASPAATPATQLADRKTPAEMPFVASGSAPAQAPAGSVNGVFGTQAWFADKATPPASAPVVSAPPPTVAMTTPAASAAFADESAKLTGDASGQTGRFYRALAMVAPANTPGSSAIGADGFSQAAAKSLKETAALGVALKFIQVAPESKAKQSLGGRAAPAHPVLASFEVKQAGRELRIIDDDGSVYSGYVQLADTVRRALPAPTAAPAAALASRAPADALEEAAAPRLDSDQLAPRTYSFRVAGTNRGLNRKVVFTGNFLTVTNPSFSLWAATNLSIQGGLGGSGNAPAGPSLLPLRNSRISGKVVIGSGNAVEINALPANP